MIIGPMATQRSYCLPFCYQILDHLGYQSASSVRTVIGGDIEISGNCLHFFLQNDQVFGLCTNDHICINSVLMKPFYLGIYRCGTYTAGNKQNLLLLHFFKIIRARAQTDVPEDLQNLQKASPAFRVANFSVEAPMG